MWALRLFCGIYTHGIHLGLYIWSPALYRFSRIHRGPGAGRSATSGRRGDREARQGLQYGLSGAVIASRPGAGASQCFYPFEVRTPEDTGSTRRL